MRCEWSWVLLGHSDLVSRPSTEFSQVCSILRWVNLQMQDAEVRRAARVQHEVFRQRHAERGCVLVTDRT